MTRLSTAQIKAALLAVPEWQRQRATLTRTCVFEDFVTAIRFVNRVARLAEKAGHHPDLDIRWNKVTLRLTTHDAGGLTEKDFALAKRIDALCDSAGPARRRPGRVPRNPAAPSR